MGNMELLSDALVYIEEHLHEKICTEEIAEACFCSKSTLEKLFRCVTGFTVRDYLMRRRMAKAAREIAEQPEQNILTLALKYGYSSHESFMRAFKTIWNCKPSEYRERSYFNLFPKLTLRSEEGDEYIRMGREPITYNGRKIPLELYAGVVKMKGDHIQYNDLFCNLHKEIQESKE